MFQPPASSAQADREIDQYHRFSGWALVALLLGFLSAGAIAGPVLWFVPLLAIAFSLLAMQKIRASENQLYGWHIALLGLLLAVFFGIAGPARTISRRYYIEKRAAYFAEKFMDQLVQNQPEEAFQFTIPPGSRKPLTGDSRQAMEKNADLQKAHDDFLKLATVKALLELAGHEKVELLSAEYTGSDEAQEIITVKFQVRDTQDSAAKPKTVVMGVQRTLTSAAHSEEWRILPWALQNTPE
jgi:hypothetical protein